MLSQLDGLHSLVDEYTAASAGTRVPLLRRENCLAQKLISLSDTPPLPLHAAVAPGREKPGGGNTVSLSSPGTRRHGQIPSGRRHSPPRFGLCARRSQPTAPGPPPSAAPYGPGQRASL